MAILGEDAARPQRARGLRLGPPASSAARERLGAAEKAGFGALQRGSRTPRLQTQTSQRLSGRLAAFGPGLKLNLCHFVASLLPVVPRKMIVNMLYLCHSRTKLI